LAGPVQVRVCDGDTVDAGYVLGELRVKGGGSSNEIEERAQIVFAVLGHGEE
jgi:hypothetical protein